MCLLLWCDFVFDCACDCDYKGATIQSPGGTGVFVPDKLFISTPLGGALKISNFITCLYRTALEINYLFLSNCLFKKNISPPPPLKIEWWPPNCVRVRVCDCVTVAMYVPV